MNSTNPVAIPDKVEQIEWGSEILTWLRGKFTFVGAVGTVLATGFLVYYAQHFSASLPLTPSETQDAANLIGKFGVGLTLSLLALGVGIMFSFWGDFALPITLLILAALYYFSPDLLPMTGLITDSYVPGAEGLSAMAIKALHRGGLFLGAFAIGLQLVDAALRIRNRAVYGTHQDQIKYGKGIKEEADYQNVFMGKCWQLPFCRKFVREACPIYHSRRTCWRERVGCMCEEEVIRGALEGKTIPRDVVAAAKFIPRTSRATPQQKAERCRQCVIYNEHQRHKYRLSVPIALSFVALIYLLFQPQLLNLTNNLLHGFDLAMSRFTFANDPALDRTTIGTTPGFLEHGILILLMLFLLSQIMRAVEFGIFKLKI